MFADRVRALGVALIATAALSGTARAQSPEKRAAALNDEGKQLMFATPPNYEQAAVKFRQAIVLAPQGKYYYNLCIALSKNGDLGNALMSCEAVAPNGSTPELKEKADELAAQIKAQLQSQGVTEADVHAAANQNPTGTNPDGSNPTGTNPTGTNPDGSNPTGTNPTGTNPTGTNPDGSNPTGTNPTGTNPNGMAPVGANPALARFHGAPPPSLFATAPPSHDYTYTLGAALEAGPASIGTDTAYGSAAAGVRIFSDLLFSPRTKVGGEGYLDFMTIPDGSAMSTGGMSMFDVGVGFYKHFCKSRMCVTPLIGAHIVGYTPTNSSSGSQAYASVGGRGQVQLGYAFGPRYEHFLTFTLGADVDAKPLGNYDVPPSDATIGLDKGGVLVLFSIGYQYRFNTPLGSTPFFNLE